MTHFDSDAFALAGACPASCALYTMTNVADEQHNQTNAIHDALAIISQTVSDP